MGKNKKKAAFAGAVLIVIILFAAAAGVKSYFTHRVSSDETQTPEEYVMKALYLEKDEEQDIFINLTDEYPFHAAIPEGELYDEEGIRISEQDLNNGDVLDIYGNGVIAESYPAQYHGITKIERTEQKNQKLIEQYGYYLEELFAEEDLSRRPHMNVCYSDETASVAVMIPDTLSYTWTFEENGENQTITTDAPHILQTTPTEVKKLSEPMKMELEFDQKPESILLLSWEDTLLGKYEENAAQIPEGTEVELTVNEKGNPEFTAQPGCVYLVQGQWENGTADYAFRVPAE